jgi:hypothetical protein
MSPIQPNESAANHIIQIPGIVTLDPLRNDGPDALETHDIPDFSDVVLRELEVTCDNINAEVIIKRAANLFKTAGDPAPVPNRGDLTRGVLDLHRPNQQKPNKLEIVPPATVKLSDPADAPAVVKLLKKKHFCIAEILLPFLLAAATAFAAAVDDDDSDDDDPDTDRCVLAT